MIYLILILSLNFSCFEHKSYDKEKNNTEIHNTSQSDTLKLGSGIRVIFQDSKGNYWFGIHNGGVCRFDGNSFKYLTFNEGLLDNQIQSIEEDKNGNILISTSKGLSIYDGQNFINYATKIDLPIANWNETRGDLWFSAGNNDGINRFDGKQLNYLLFPKQKNYDPDDSYSVTDISKDKENVVWIATYAALFSFEGKTLSSVDFKSLNLNTNEKLHIRSVLADSKGRVWIGNNGIGVILKTKNEISHFSKEKGKLIPMDEFETNTKSKQFIKNTGLQSVFVIFEDSKGNIWFGDRDSGAWKYDGIKLTNYTVDTKLNSQMIWSIYEDHSKNLLFGMAEGGVYEFNGKTFEKKF